MEQGREGCLLWAFWAREASPRIQPGDYRDPEVFHSAPQLVCAVRKSPRPPWPVVGCPCPIQSLSPGLGRCTRPESLFGEPEPTWGSETLQKWTSQHFRKGPGRTGRGGPPTFPEGGGGALCTGPALSHPGPEQAR